MKKHPRPVVLFCMLMFVLCGVSPHTGQASQNEHRLEPGQKLSQELSANQSHLYLLRLQQGQGGNIEVEQLGIDLRILVKSPAAQLIAEGRLMPYLTGTERVRVTATTTGDYSIEVHATNPQAIAGRYEIRIGELVLIPPGDADDANRLAAQHDFTAASQLLSKCQSAACRPALEQLRRSSESWRALGDYTGQTMSLLNLGETHLLLGDFRQAYDTCQQAATLAAAHAEPHAETQALSCMATSLTNLGETNRAFTDATRSLTRAREIGDLRLEAQSLERWSQINHLLGQIREESEGWEKAIAIRRQIGDRREEAISLFSTSNSYLILGEFQRALSNCQTALPILRELKDLRSEANALANLAVVYRNMGLYQQSVDAQTRGLQINREIGDRLGEASALHRLGTIYVTMGKPNEGIPHLMASLPLCQELNSPFNEALAYSGLGGAYTLLGNTKKAFDANQEALTRYRKTGNRFFAARTLMSLGRLALLNNQPQNGRELYQTALSIQTDIGDLNGKILTLYGLAAAENLLGNPEVALQQADIALELTENVRARIRHPDLRAVFMATVEEQRELHVNLLMQLNARQPGRGYDNKALQLSERMRARGLLELLIEARIDIREGVDPQLLTQSRKLQQMLNAKAERQARVLSQQADPKLAQALQQEINTLSAEYQEIQSRIRLNNPRYASLLSPPNLTVEQLQQLLDPDTILLEYALGKDQSYFWVLTNTELHSYYLPNRAKIEELVKQAHKLVSNYPTAASTTGYEQVAQQLSRMLLAPAAKQFGTKRLLIVGDGALHYLPFSSLPDPAAPHQPLLVNHEIISLPSASTLFIQRNVLPPILPSSQTLAIYADPVFGKYDDRLTKNMTPAKPGLLATNRNVNEAIKESVNLSNLFIPRLPFSRLEAQRIAKLVSTTDRTVALDFQANRTDILAASPRQSRFVHFATHGQLNSAQPELSALIFSLVDEQGQPQNGFLRLNEIYNLKLPAELVVLSACETALGQEIKGEGLIGLTRGFMHAGAQRVVASLWKVNDSATADLMERFYGKMLTENLTPAAALRAAQLEMWRQEKRRPPFFWGAFTLQGEWLARK